MSTYYARDSVAVTPPTDWNDSVTIIDDARAAMFDTNRFHRFKSVVAKPIRQQYTVDGGDNTSTFVKPPNELKKARSSLLNAPLTLGHPSSGRVSGVDDVHGFFGNVAYDTTNEALEASLYVPVDDEQAHTQLENVSDVSLGFYHELDRDVEFDSVDAYQRDLLIDHVAAVESGRCSSEDGCQIMTDCGDDCDCSGESDMSKYESDINDVPRVPLDNLHIDDVHPHHRGRFERVVRAEAQSRDDWREFLTDKGIEVHSESDSDSSQESEQESVSSDGDDEESTEQSLIDDASKGHINPLQQY